MFFSYFSNLPDPWPPFFSYIPKFLAQIRHISFQKFSFKKVSNFCQVCKISLIFPSHFLPITSCFLQFSGQISFRISSIFASLRSYVSLNTLNSINISEIFFNPIRFLPNYYQISLDIFSHFPRNISNFFHIFFERVTDQLQICL